MGLAHCNQLTGGRTHPLGWGKRFIVTCKGAPERLRSMFIVRPENYDAVHTAFAQRGSRVLALGYKKLEDVTTQKAAMEITREQAESELIFGGFLIVSSPIKDDSASAIDELTGSGQC